MGKQEVPANAVYSDEVQREILLQIPRIVIPRFRAAPSVREVRLDGSLSTLDFGIGSIGLPDDINLVVFADRIPKGWKRAEVYRAWYSLYNFPDMPFYIHDGKEHALDLLVVRRGCEKQAREAIRDTSGLLYTRNGQ